MGAVVSKSTHCCIHQRCLFLNPFIVVYSFIRYYVFSCFLYWSWINKVISLVHEFFTRCSDAYSDTMLGYANSIRTIDGGTHIDGVKASLTRTLNSLAKKSKIVKVCLYQLPQLVFFFQFFHVYLSVNFILLCFLCVCRFIFK